MSKISKYTGNEEERLIKIGRNIREIRENKGISQKTLAAWLNCTQDHLSRVEYGTGRMSLYQLIQFCKQLKVSPNQVLDFPPDERADQKTWEEYIEYKKLKPAVKQAISGLIKSIKENTP